MKYYKTENLYVGLLGIVRKIDSNKIRIENTNKFIIYRKEVIDPISIYRHDMAKDIFSDKLYYFFSGNEFPKDTIFKAINSHAISESYPIENYLDFPKKKVSRSELLVILDKLNHPHEEEKKEEATEPITDNILKTILETSDLVKVSSISEELKETTIKELETLAENYVKDIEEFNKEGSINPFDSEYQIRMMYIKSLVDVEAKISDPKAIKTHSLKMQLQTFKKELNQND